MYGKGRKRVGAEAYAGKVNDIQYSSIATQQK